VGSGILVRVTDERRARWERAAEWPLTIGAILFLVAYAWPILDPGLSPGVVAGLELLGWVIWGLFAVDYLVRVWLARRRRNFVRRHLFDLAVIVLPLLRPLRLLRLVTLLSVLNRYAGASMRGRVAVYVGGSTVLVLLVAALTALDAERGAEGGNIESFGDALWWAMTTVTTVGYGDQFPVTPTGRFVAAGLMLAGIALLGVVTASLASWLIDRVAEVEEESQAATRRDVHELAEEVLALRREVARLTDGAVRESVRGPES
jgi:voltage-gated potassium channel